MLELDTLSRRYGKLPSEIANGDIADLQLDILVASIGIEEEIKQHKKAMEDAKRKRRR